MKKRIVASLLSFSVLLTGCTVNKTSKAETALEEKYGEDFEVLYSYGGAGLFTDWFDVRAISVKYPDLPFIAHVNTDGKAVSDEYVQRLICNELSEKIKENLSEAGIDNAVYSEFLLSAWEYTDPSITFADFASQDPDMEYGIHICIDYDNDFEKAVSLICSSALRGISPIQGNLYLYLANDTMIYRFNDYIRTNDKLYSDCKSMMSPYALDCVHFEDNILSYSEFKQ